MSARSTRRGPWTVRAYLLFIAINCTLPVAIFGGYFAYHFVSEASARQQADLEERLALMRNAVDQRVETIIAELEVLAHSPDLEAGNLARFRNHAEHASRLIGSVTVLLSDRDGNQLVNTRPLPPGAPIPRRQHLEAQNKAWDTGTPQVSDLYPAAVDGQQVISIEVPVLVDGAVRYMLAAGIVSSTFSDLMQQYVPEAAIGSIIDRNGVLIARRPVLDQTIGTRTIPEVLQHIGERSAFWIKATSRSGVPTYTSIFRSDLTGWTVDLAVARESVDGPLRKTVLLFSGMGLVALLAGLLLARLISTRFLRAFATLQEHVRLLASRQPASPEHGPVVEINAMDATLYTVANHLGEIMHRQEILLGEINHRVKNTLATISAIARVTRTSATSVPDFVKGFQARVSALSRAYDLLTTSDWAGADLAALVEMTIAPFTRSNRVRICGPSIVLRPKFALAMAAAVQELTTNAAKYGALSDVNGALDIRWTAEGQTVHLEWQESDGPPVNTPTRRGFGTKLIEDLLAKDTGWTVELKYLASGLECRITMHDAVAPGLPQFAEAAQ